MTEKPDGSTHESPMDRPDGGGVDEELFDDPIVSKSLASLTRVEVPSGLLPNIMYRVYETHLRERISLKQIAAICALLITICIGFFAWDVQDYTRGNSLGGFGEGMERKVDEMVAEFDSLVQATDGVLSATWQLVTALGELVFSGGGALPILLLIVAIVVLILVFQKWKTRNFFKSDAT